MPCLFIWKAGDLLTSYDGKPFYYDAVGNITFDGYWNYTWTQGRQLSQMYDDNMSVIWSYTYDANGMRTSRYSNGGTEYTYVYNGSQLSRMTYGSNTLYFSYDAAGAPMTVNYNGTTYYYVTNLQGDVIAILNSTGSAVVQYTYDAWGKPLSIEDESENNLGALNPLRYRGYVYDRETGLYYLQSRYYNPTWGRFISPDDTAYLDPGSVNGLNLYCYCNNDPVSLADPNGHFAIAIPVIIKLAVAVVAVTAVATFAATINDIYQLARGNVSSELTSSVDKGDSKDNVQIVNSHKIITPWVQYGYAYYLNYFNKETKDAIDGTTEGAVFEWVIHNLGYVAFSVLGNKKRADQARDVDLGRTLFADSHGGLIEHGMKISYLLCSPITAIFDMILNGGYT